MHWFYAFDLFGVALQVALPSLPQGALTAGRKGMDLFGVLVVAIITALGGGTLRDIILDHHPVGWIRDETYILVACTSALGSALSSPRGTAKRSSSNLGN